LFDDGDGVMIPSPYYGGYDNDFVRRPGARVVPVPLSSSNGFILTEALLEETYQAATAQGIRVRALVITNPENPTGVVFSKTAMLSFAAFARRHDLHFVVNEMYFMSVHDPSGSTVHESVLTFEPELLPPPEKLHLVWGFSKSFGMSGFRVGCIITQSAPLLEALQSLAYFSSISGLQQHQLGLMVDNTAWLDRFLAESNARLHESYLMAEAMLKNLDIPFIPSGASFFLYINLTQFMPTISAEAERDLWLHLIDRGLSLASFFTSLNIFRSVHCPRCSLPLPRARVVPTYVCRPPVYSDDCAGPHESSFTRISARSQSTCFRSRFERADASERRVVEMVWCACIISMSQGQKPRM
jgi:aspartate/methionine/tyrosine aminotransferase